MTISTLARDTLALSRGASEFCALIGNSPKYRQVFSNAIPSMAMTGVHPKMGLTTGEYEQAAVKRALSQAAVLAGGASSSRIGKCAT